MLQSAAAIYLMCDVRAMPMVRAPLAQKPAIFIYDDHAGGVGFSKRLFAMHDELKVAARDLITKRGCAAGCPSCVGPALEIGEQGKAGALRVLEVVS